MNSQHICLGCRRRLSQIRPRAIRQWQPRATFISLNTLGPRPNTTDERRQPHDGLLTLGDDLDTADKYAKVLPGTRARKHRAHSNDPGDILESIFEESIKPSPPSSNPTQSSSSLEPYKHAEILNKLLQDSAPIADCWAYFLEHFRPGLAKNKSSPSYLISTTKTLQAKLKKMKTTKPHSKLLPSVTEISKIYLQLGILYGSDWTDMVFSLLDAILRCAPDEPLQRELVEDLAGAWNVVCRDKSKLHHFPPAGSSLDWSHLPPVLLEDVASVQRQRGSADVFGLLIPHFELRELRQLPLAAVATFGVLKSVQGSGEDLTTFMTLLSRVITGAVDNPTFDPTQTPTTQPIGSLVPEFVKKEWPQIKGWAAGMSSPMHTPSQPRVKRTPETDPGMNISYVNERLFEALEARNIREVDKIWSDVKIWPVLGEGNTNLKGTLSPKLCNYLILVYMELKQPNRAIEVWNHMVKSGLNPGVQAWDAMLSGCKESRDARALEDVWQKMQISGTQPDIYCWTTRISGLLQCNKIELSLQALDQMGRTWLEAAKQIHPKMPLEKLLLVENVEGAVKPAITVINATLSGIFRQSGRPLSRQAQGDVTRRILAWAGNFQIKPDIVTFNTLLRPLIADGQSEQAMDLLKQMQQAGVQADVVTFTTILDETFRYADQLSPAEQAETVNTIFSSMQAAGVQANSFTYSKIISQLLLGSTRSMPIVNAVLERMSKQGLTPTNHIFTTLVRHYFDQTPPDINAARNMIERASIVPGSVDHIFWDRCVEGYARAGETAAALNIVGKTQSTGNTIGWIALRTLLLALAQKEEWTLAQSMVRNAVADTGGPLSPHVHGKEGQHSFWDLARDLNLLKS